MSLDLAPAGVDVERLPDGGLVLRSPQPLGSYDSNLGLWLRRWAADRPERIFLAERSGGGWRQLTYAEALQAAERIASALLERRLGENRPVMILSGNSVNHGLVMLGGFLAGVPIAPVSPAYSLMSADYGKLKHIYDTVAPGLIFMEALGPFEGALGALDLSNVELVSSHAGSESFEATSLEKLLKNDSADALKAVEVGPDTVAKYLFTSGSTGQPKGVINTHGMLCANQQMTVQLWPFLEARPPVLLDWLPWNHTFGGNFIFGLVLKQGGTLYVDDGKPQPQLIGRTVENLRMVSPTAYFNVPAGYAQLIPYLESDENLRERFFSKLEVILYAAAALPDDLWERMQAAMMQVRSEPVFMASAWGSTETAPLATMVHYRIERPGNIGLPAPGVEIKMVPAGDKMELGVRGPNVTPGYLKRPDLTAEAFDDDGFYRIGDAGKLADPQEPSRGLVFDGRVAEDFKLTTGTWVPSGRLRVEALAAASPVLQDAVVAGHDREYVALLAWPNFEACRKMCGDPPDAEPASLVRHEAVIACVRQGLAAHNADNPASSTTIRRVLLMTEPPNIDHNEITDKGYINQSATLANRADLVARLFQESAPDDVIVIGDE